MGRNARAICFGIVFLTATICGINSADGFQSLESLVPVEQELPVGDIYDLDNAHTSVVFAVQHFGLSFTYGRFNQCSGSFALDGGKVTSKGFNFKIDANSVDTNNDDRDKHLRGPEFFNTDQFAEIEFKTNEIRTGSAKGTLEVIGELTMLGVSKPLTLSVREIGVGSGPFGKQRAGYFTKFEIKRSEFGMKKMLGQVGDKVAITFSFEGVKR
jgi:polyisoprenoid-binding protein YceI